MKTILYMNRDQLLAVASHFADEPGCCLLYSGSSYDSAKRSFLCLYPEEIISIPVGEAKPWETLEKSIGSFSGKNTYPLWTGFFAYEMGAFSDPDVQIPFTPSDLPLCYFQKNGLVLEVDHQTGKSLIHGNQEVFNQTFEAKKFSSGASHIVQPLESMSDYKKKVSDAIELILSGDIYQVNLSQEMVVKSSLHPFSIFQQLAEENPAPFSAYMNLGSYHIISSSPERLLKKCGQQLETRPIKGTAPRSVSPEALLSSEKDRAELLMIIDLMRNDLGKVSEWGSVKVKELYKLETYRNVHHLLSIIQSVANQNYTTVQLVRNVFPGGSITGCPKIRAMEVIHQLENRPRGIYTGSIGYFAENGDFDFNIAIRTAIAKEELVKIQLGGAIVVDSDPQDEYNETLHKGESLFKSILTS